MRMIAILVLALIATTVNAQDVLDPNWGRADLQQISVDGYAFNYVEAGDGAPVVLVHGGLLDYRYWQPTVEAGASRYHMITYSRRHFYPNAVNTGDVAYSAWTDVKDLEGFIEGLGLGPVHLVGHSEGGHTSLLLTIRRPDLVRSLVLEEGGFISEGSPKADAALSALGPVFGQYIELYAAGETEAAVTLFLDAVLGEGGFAAQSDGMKQVAYDNAHTLATRPNPPMTCAQVGGVTVPTMLVRGGASPPVVGDLMVGLAQCLEGEETVTIAGASHTVHVDQPQAFNTALLKFLEQQ